MCRHGVLVFAILLALSGPVSASVFTVVNTKNGGAGSLREAVADANANAGPDTIVFDIPQTDSKYDLEGYGEYTIKLNDSLQLTAAGTTIDGTTQPGFAGSPLIQLDGGPSLLVDGLKITGGDCTVRGLVINRFDKAGIELSGGAGNVVAGNYIGTDVSGMLARANGQEGIAVSSAGNVIGGTSAPDRNVISGNGKDGIVLDGDDNVVSGNHIGTDVSGTLPLANDGAGIDIGSTGNTIGGLAPGAANVVSGNLDEGIVINPGSNNVIQGNYVGTDLTGGSELGNGSSGIYLRGASTGNSIGGTSAAAGNVISGNAANGVEFDGSGVTGNSVSGNVIGSDPTGTIDLGNTLSGVLINKASLSTVGGNAAAAANVIAYNNEDGVRIVLGAVDVLVRWNSIYDNDLLGIDLGGDGVTPNDAGDADSGPNLQQNYPILTAAALQGGNTLINAVLESTPSTTFQIDLYSDDTPDPSGFGEGRVYVTSETVTTDSAGFVFFGALLPPLPLGSRLTATATSPAGNTSEFGNAIAVSNAGAVADLAATNDDGLTSYTPGGVVSYTVVASNSGPGNVNGATVTVPLASLPQVLGVSWTCVGTGGANCTAGPVAGDVSDNVALPAGSSATYTVDVQLSTTASGALVSTATVTPPAGTADPDVSDNLATDTDSQGPWIADLAITKDDGLTLYSAGDPLTYTIVVSNAGPSDATIATVTDALSFVPQIDSASWSCTPTGLATCTEGSVVGDISDTVYLPVGEILTYTVDVDTTPSAIGDLINTATVTAGPGGVDPEPLNDSATDQDAPVQPPVDIDPTPNIELIPAGSLVIAMDNDKQNLAGTPFNLKAYGLVTDLLWNEIPVKWVIRAGKAKDGIDFSANAARVSPSAAPAAPLDFRGGPFIVTGGYALDALPRIAAFGSAVAVYQLAEDTPVDVRYTLTHKPKVAALDDGGNAGIHTDVLDDAGFVFGLHYEIIDVATLTNINASSCFTFATEAHCTGDCADAQVEAARAFAASGANFLAQCAAIPTYENNSAHGLFQTTNGIVEDNLGNAGFLYPQPDLSFGQFEGPLAAAGGSVNDFELVPHSGFQNNGHVHVQDATLTDHYAATASQLTPGPGSHVFYLGGHDYAGSDLGDLNGQRMYLNAAITPALRPPPCGLNFTPVPVIGGKVYEDTDGDGDLSGEPGRPGVELRLYLDGGDEAGDGIDDALVETVTTGGDGSYLFQNLSPGNRYWLSVDSATVTPSAGFISGSSQIDVWAEQTRGPRGSECDDGNGGVVVLDDAGICFGGRDSTISDAAASLATSEHVVGTLLGLAIYDVDFGFSFATVVNELDALVGTAGGNRSVQGSLRQFLQNSNAVAGVQTSVFRIPENPGTFDGSSFRITPIDRLPVVLDPVVVDGRTQPGFVGRPVIELDGTLAGGPGLLIEAGSSTVRGLVINRFQKGLQLDVAGGNVVEGNFIGTDAAGTTVIGNSGEGIQIRSDDNRIGGSDPAARNLISGNAKEGIKIDGEGNVVQGNFIGTDLGGTLGLGNLGVGVSIRGANNFVGGSAAGEGNVVSDGVKEGVLVRDDPGNVVAGNRIGTDVNGTLDLGNARSGVFVDRADGTIIGGLTPDATNTIAYNGENGVTVDRAVGVAILRNSIHTNDLLGIDLDKDGVTTNDDDDPDDGANGLQNFPVTTSVVVAGGQTTIGGLLNSTPSTGFTIHFYASDVADPGSFGEGQRYMGELTVVTDPAGNAPFTTILPVTVTGNEVVTATATAPDGSTSEFSVAFTFVELTGTIYEDADGDGDPTGAIGRPNVGLSLYRDGGDGAPTGNDDLLVDSVVTEADGFYSFPGVLPATYWVVADSRTLTPDAGLRGGFVATDVWAEQTYGIAGAWCDDGAGGTSELLATGTCYGGRRALVSDSAAALGTAEHLTRVVVGDDAVGGVDFGFSFSAAVHTRAGDDDPATNRSIQGGLRQFVQNSNAIDGVQASVFRIPTSDPEYDNAGAGEFTITPEQALPDIVDPLILDGTTQPGYSGAPLIVLAGDGAGAADGLRIVSGDSTIRGLAIIAFDDDGIDLTTSGNNRVEGNWIGVRATGLAAQANDGHGIRAEGPDNVIGGLAAGQTNVISGNKLSGMLLSGNGASGNLVQGNKIGTSVDGSFAVKNVLNGIEIANAAAGNTIGGTAPEARNLVSGNGLSGVVLTGAGTTDNHVRGNYIGTNASGGVDLPNADDGVLLSAGASGNTIGGTISGAGNVLSGNLETGIHILGSGTSGNLVQANHIGVDATGLAPVPNRQHGVWIEAGAGDNTVGGASAASRNVVSANDSHGVYLLGPGTTGNHIGGNYIGVGADGTSDLGNGSHGVWLDTADGNTIGGTAVGAGNRIGRNGSNGIYLSDSNDNTVQGNAIGTSPSGTGDLGNADRGVELEDSDRNAIGGTDSGAGNTVAFNGGAGVSVKKTSDDNPIRRNSIFDNVGLGIDLNADGVTANDPADVDGGANGLQNYPVLATAIVGSGSTTVYGTLESSPATSFTVDLYSSPADDPTGYGEGATFIGSSAVVTDASGYAAFALGVPVAVTLGHVVTATATGPSDDTSEFSAAVTAAAPNSGPTSCNVFADRDAWLSEANPNNNYGSDDELRAQQQLGDDSRPVVHFDLTALTGSTVVSATAWFYLTDPDESGSALAVHAINDGWAEPSVTWANTAADLDPATQGTLDAGAVGFSSVDLTALAQSWIDGATPNHGLALLPSSLDVKSSVSSREWATIAERPCMEIVTSISANLVVTKDDGAASYTPGGTVTYTIGVGNSGPDAVNDAVVTDPVTSLPQVAGASWTCVAAGGAACTPGPVTGDLSDVVDLPVGSNVTFTLVVDVDTAATGDLTNMATVTLPTGATDPDPLDNSASDTDVPSLVADLRIVKDDSVTSYVPGSSVTYKIVVDNAGPSAVSGATVADPVTGSPQVADTIWTCAAIGGATCNAGPLSGDINDVVDLPVGGTLTYTLIANLHSDASGDLVNTATIVAPSDVTDPDSSNDASVDTDTAGAGVADLTISNADGVTTYTPGTSTNYTITVGNAGPSDASGTSVSAAVTALPQVSAASWTCSASGAATCTPGPVAGDLVDVIDLPVGGLATYTLVVDTEPDATGDLVTTATVAVPAGMTDPNPDDNDATDTDSMGSPVADLHILKDDGVPSYTPGGSVTYTIVVSNAGPSTVTGAAVSDIVSGLPQVSSADWSCTAGPGAACASDPGTGDITDSVDLSPNSEVTYTLTLDLEPSATGDLINTATVTAPGAASDPDPSDNASTDTDTEGTAVADLAITKSDGVASYTPGGTVTYVISATNSGPAAVTGATVTDAVTALSQVTDASWTCAGAGGASCTAGPVTGDIADTLDLPVGATAAYTLVVDLASDATGDLINVATIVPPASTVEADAANNTATDTDVPGPSTADLSITIDDGVTSYTPGGTVTYTIVVGNDGPSAIAGATVTDNLIALPQVADVSWSCIAAGGATCTTGPTAGDLLDTIDLPVGATATYTVVVDLDPSAGGDLVNTAAVTLPAGALDPDPADNSASDTDTRGTLLADLAISKTDGASSYLAGGTVRYTVVVTNLGPGAVVGATVTDPLTGLPQVTGASWSCVAGSGASCATGPQSGDLVDSVDLLPGSQVTYTIDATLEPAATGDLINTADVTAPGGTVDPDPANDSATDTDTQGTSLADLSITKDDGVTNYTPGASVTYTIVVGNSGPSAVSGAVVTDAVTGLPQVASASWTCAAAGGASCAGGTVVGDLNDTIDLPVGSSASYTLVVGIDSAATGDLINVATITAPAGTVDPDSANNTATDSDARGTATAELGITKDDGVTSYTPGGSVTYSITVGNSGPSAANGVTVTDAVTARPQVSSATWTCAAVGGASCTSGPVAGDINDVVSLPVGGSVTYTLAALLEPDATGDLVNTANLTLPADTVDPTPLNTASDTDSEGSGVADLGVTISDGVTSYTPGGTLTYTVVVSNAGPSAVNGATISNLVSTVPQITAASWTCVPTGGASCAAGSGDLLDVMDLPVGSTATYTLVVDVDPAAIGELTDTVTVATPAGVIDPDSSDNLAEDIDAQGAAVAQLAISKDDGLTSYTPGGSVVYTIVASNAGPSSVSGVTVGDAVAGLPQVAGASWTCTASPGASCTPGPVSGNINDAIDLPAAGSATYVLTVDLLADATGDLVNTASLVTPPGTVDPVPGDNGATDTDTPGGPVADLSITKDDGVTSYSPGGSVTYTIVVTNSGPSAISGATVTDDVIALPQVSAASWTCTPGGGASCATGSVAGDIADTIDLPVGATATYLLVLDLAPSSTGELVNTAAVAPPAGANDPDPTNDRASDTDTQGLAVADLSVSIDDGVVSYIPGDSVTYTVVVSNAGPSPAGGVAIDAPVTSLPQVTSASWTCGASAGATCTAGPNGGDLSDLADLPPGGSATYTLTVGLAPDATLDLITTASLTLPAGFSDPTPADHSATDTDTRGPPTGDLTITIDDGAADYSPGGTATYTIVVQNTGPSAIEGADVSCDVTALPQVTGASWTCTAAVGGVCTAGPVVGDLGDSVDLAAGAAVTYTLVTDIDPAAASDLVVVAGVVASAATIDPNPANNSATDTDTRGAPSADLSLTKTVDDPSPEVATNVTFAVTVTNSGPSTATGIVVTDLLPDGYAYVEDDSLDTGTSYFPASGIWTVGGLAPGASRVLSITAEVERSGDYVNVAEIASANESDPDSTPGNGQPEDDTDLAATMPVGADGSVDITDTIHPGEPLTVTVVDADMDVDPGSAETLEVTVVNAATGEAESLLLTETGPNTGVFQGVLATVYGDSAGPDDDAVLTVRAGQAATATYTDNFNATGTPIALTDTGSVVGGTDATLVIAAPGGPGEPLTLTVTDADTNADPGLVEVVQVTVVNDRTGETETVLLTETGPSTGIFEAPLQTALDPVVGPDENGTLNVQPNDSLTGKYADAITSAGNSGVVTGNTVLSLDVIRILKQATQREVVIGDAVGFELTVTNTATASLSGVTLEDRIPPGFKFVKDSASLIRAGTDGLLGTDDDVQTTLDATGVRPIVFGPLDLAASETARVRYALQVGTGATPGEKINKVTPLQGSAIVGSTATARVELVADAIFDLTTIIGKVFEDVDHDGFQDRGERGVPRAQVVLDDGTYAITDPHGRFHIPVVSPGQRMLKLNLDSLPPGASVTRDISTVLWVTPGLIARANFGVVLAEHHESIGELDDSGLSVSGRTDEHPVQVLGRAEALTALINGQQVDFSASDVKLVAKDLDHGIMLAGNAIDAAMRFDLRLGPETEVLRWRVEILDGENRPLKVLRGEGAPPSRVSWNGRLEDGQLVESGRVYQYRFEVETADGRASSPRRLFGVNRQTVMSIELTGEAFPVGQATLSESARHVLRQAGTVLTQYPNEPVVIEGHTDSVGSEASNLELSRQRAESAAAFFVDELNFPRERLVQRWFGESRPLASNRDAVGRQVNRRVEVKAAVQDVQDTPTLGLGLDRPGARIDGVDVELDSESRFIVEVPADGARGVDVELRDSAGRIAQQRVALPELVIVAPKDRIEIPFGVPTGGCTAERTDAGDGPTVTCELVGRTDAGSRVWVDGHELATGNDGTFRSEVPLRMGSNSLGLLVRNASGFSRSGTFVVEISDRDEEGRLYVVARGIPNLTVDLPPPGVRLRTPTLPLSGQTDPGNRVWANDEELEVRPDGSFFGSVDVPAGTSTLVVRVEDPEGRIGSIERELEAARTRLFLMALADGTFGKLEGRGFIEGTGLDEADDYYTDGRLAFYLQGVIRGKYLINAAFDSERGEFDSLFEGLDGEGNRELLVNLDPDRIYPVYGDSSEVVFGANSQGKLYLSLSSDEIDLLVGNYALAYDDTELAEYRRTLYGGSFQYHSASTSLYGESDTQVALFVADVRQIHVEDQLRATGGSLYYLSHRDVVEGSEQVNLVVRDKNTGLVLYRQPQQQNVDYLIKYPEGRLIFHRPISRVVESGSIVDRQILAGHRVSIYVDYETFLDSFEETGAGGRVRQQIGDHVAVGATYIDDNPNGSPYELKAMDAEVRLGRNTRLLAEYADSSGADSRIFLSDDGGLSYAEGSVGDSQQGSAWKATAELDVGEWFGRADRYRVNLYFKELEPGFSASGTFREQGTNKQGINASLELTGSDSLQVRHDREERVGGGGPLPGLAAETTISSVQWNRTRKRWGVTAEFFDTQIESATPTTDGHSSLAAARAWGKPTAKLDARLERQQTLSGHEDDRTTLGLEYRALPSLALTLEGTDGTLGRSAQGGAIWTKGESSIYLTERIDDSQAGQRTTTVVGSRSSIGRNTQVYSEYHWEGADSGDQTMSLLGLQRQWEIGEGLRLLVSGENSRIDGDAAVRELTSISAGLYYSRMENLKAFTRQEVRYQSGGTRQMQYFTVNQLNYQLNPDFALLGRFRYSKTEDRDTDAVAARFDERVVGLAFRPVKHDRFNSLAKYSRLTDLRPVLAGALESSDRTMEVVSIETAYQITPRIEWLAKCAARVHEQRLFDLPKIKSRTVLVVQRLNFNIWQPIYLGAEYRQLVERSLNDKREGILGEASWQLVDHFRLGIGYNFTDFSDDEFSTNDYSVRGWFFRVQGKY